MFSIFSFDSFNGTLYIFKYVSFCGLYFHFHSVPVVVSAKDLMVSLETSILLATLSFSCVCVCLVVAHNSILDNNDNILLA